MFDASAPPDAIPLMQDRAFAAALRLCGENPVILPSGLLLLSRRIAGLPVLMLPRAVPPSDLRAQLVQAGLHRRPLILSPEQPCARLSALWIGALRIAADRGLLRMDLRAPVASRRAALHQNWRHQLGQAETGPLRVLHRPMTPDHPLLVLSQQHERTHGYRNWPRALTAAFVQAAPAQTHLFTALLRGHSVAHMLFLTHGARATYHIGHTTDAGRNSRAHNLLLWEAVNTLAARGTTTLDLGPATTPQIDRFKRRAGAELVPTGGTWLRWTPLSLRGARRTEVGALR
jgi:hypothetical protein